MEFQPNCVRKTILGTFLYTYGAPRLLAVEAKHLSKTYRAKQELVEAVKDVSFSVAPGQIYGILGPNGAGKSSVILMLTTLLRATGGSAKIFDLDVERDESKARKIIGVALQETGIDEIIISAGFGQSQNETISRINICWPEACEELLGWYEAKT